MTPEMMQLIYLAAAAAVGWFLRHRGLGAPATPATPSPMTLPANWQPNFQLQGPHPLLDALSTYMLNQLTQAIKQAPVAPALPTPTPAPVAQSVGAGS